MDKNKIINRLYILAKKRCFEKYIYSGSLTSVEAFWLLKLDKNPLLVDVRTKSELYWVGVPIVSESRYFNVEWVTYPDFTKNVNFLSNIFLISNFYTPIFLLCRSSIRSKLAAEELCNNGFRYVFNLLDGFEGCKNKNNHRKEISGWCFENLPWICS